MWIEVTASNLLLLDDTGAVLEGEGAIDATAFFIHKVRLRSFTPSWKQLTPRLLSGTFSS